MTTQFTILSSDPGLLDQATRVANEFAQQYIGEDILGIVFLGAVARGYFDQAADIDIALFKKPGATIPLPSQFLKVQGFEIHVHLEDYVSGIQPLWDMSKRWTYSQCQVNYDPKNLISQLLKDIVPLKPEERKWLLMSGLALSDWYVNSLTHLWVERGNIVSAHHMFARGLDYFFDLLFGINNELVADMKWRYYCVEKLPRLPLNFHEQIKEILRLNDFTIEEMDRRQLAFMELWQQMVPLVEQEVKLPYAEIKDLV